MAASRWQVPLACALSMVLLTGLGSWQLARRSWKLALIARVDARIHAPLEPAPGPPRWAGLNRLDDEYRHVRVQGRWLPAQVTLVAAATALGNGWWQLVPLSLADGSVVLVNRGFLSDALPGVPDLSAPAAVVTVTGLLRWSEPDGSWLRHNDPAAGRWYSRDVAAIARARGLTGTAPYFIDADAAQPEGDPRARLALAGEGEQFDRAGTGSVPVAGLTVVSFPNNHLVYAVTWFVLAGLVLSGWLRWSRSSAGS